MKKWILACIVLTASFSCQKIEPGTEYLVNYSFIKAGDGQRYYAGQYLPNPISIDIQDFVTNTPAQNFSITFTDVSGGATSPATGITDVNGIVSTTWKLGNANNNTHQYLKTAIYDKNHQYITTINCDALAFHKNSWDTVSACNESNISGLVTDKTNNITLMVSAGLYKQGQNYFDWQLDSTINFYIPYNIVIDSKGIFYISTRDGNIYKSDDHAQSWKTCTMPVPSRPYWERLKISANDHLWVTNPDNLLICSRDGGNSWTASSTGINPIHTFGTVYTSTKGILYYGGMNCLYQSTDDGKTWSLIQTPKYLQKIYVTTDDKIILYAQAQNSGGCEIYESTDYGATFTLVWNNMTPRFYTDWDYNFVQQYNSTYYLCLPGAAILKTQDFVQFETYWVNNNLLDLFIDNNGVLIAKDFNYNTVYYRKDTTTK